MPHRNCYLIYLQFLGFRYSGWQKQPGQKTVESMLHKTLKFVLGDRPFKLLGAGRTDAKVSALEYALELFLQGRPIGELDDFLDTLNLNLPPDVRALRIEPVSESFNIINDCRVKEYVYLFSFGQKLHPFCAPFMTGYPEALDLGLMQEAALLYTGTHDFRAYTTRDSKSRTFVRSVSDCRIEDNTLLQANFFPELSYMLRIRAGGFMRYQVRMIMGALVSLGRGELSLEDIRESLQPGNELRLNYVAPGSGLLLHSLSFK